MNNEHIKNLLKSLSLSDENILKVLEEIGSSGKVRILKHKAGTKDLISVGHWMKNIVVCDSNTGRNLIVQKLAGINTYTCNITHGSIGTGQATPANSDTHLTTPIVTVALTDSSIPTVNVASLQFFFPDNILANGTYYEFGTYIDTNQLFNHCLFDTSYVKAAGEDTTVEVQFTIN